MSIEWSIPPVQERESEIPDVRGEVIVTYATSSGSGGQNVNKVSSKAHAKLCLKDSKALTDTQKSRIAEYYEGDSKRFSQEGFLIANAQETRDQPINKARAIEKIQELVIEALTPERERVPTKPSRRAKERRLDKKGKQSKKKEMRQEGKQVGRRGDEV